MRMSMWLLVLSLFLAGCSSHAPPQNASLANSGVVLKQLNAQLKQWHGTPYRYGGMDQRGIDCSGFVYRTFEQRFGMQLPRTTIEQTEIGTRISRKDLRPGDLVFFKTGSGENGLHVGIYDNNDTFIHASTSRGVIRSSLDNVYWKRAYWQSRRL